MTNILHLIIKYKLGCFILNFLMLKQNGFMGEKRSELKQPMEYILMYIFIADIPMTKI